MSGAENQAEAAVIAATALTDEQRARLNTLYSELVAAYPRSSSCKRIQLDFLQVCAQSVFVSALCSFSGWIALYSELAASYPHSSCKRIQLDFLQVCARISSALAAL